MSDYSYIRVSTVEQNLDRQLIAMREIGIPSERIYIDKLSGKDTKRPQLQKLLSIVKPGDKVVVEAISRFARNTRDLLDLVEQLTQKGVEFVSQKEHIDTSTPTGKFMLTVFGAVAELERGYLLQRQKEGIAAAKARGVHLGRPSVSVPDNFGDYAELWRRGKLNLTMTAKSIGISKSTFYRRLREFQLRHK
ncbi:MAG: recombinase family protein [Clostridiales Family XIII bacterium]|jgi:DNA invertase Pin-like site-specific DNA recombinase|nr:recombinase family protein [Clostridiales Family XIII bacterium]